VKGELRVLDPTQHARPETYLLVQTTEVEMRARCLKPNQARFPLEQHENRAVLATGSEPNEGVIHEALVLETADLILTMLVVCHSSSELRISLRRGSFPCARGASSCPRRRPSR